MWVLGWGLSVHDSSTPRKVQDLSTSAPSARNSRLSPCGTRPSLHYLLVCPQPLPLSTSFALKLFSEAVWAENRQRTVYKESGQHACTALAYYWTLTKHVHNKQKLALVKTNTYNTLVNLCRGLRSLKVSATPWPRHSICLRARAGTALVFFQGNGNSGVQCSRFIVAEKGEGGGRVVWFLLVTFFFCCVDRFSLWKKIVYSLFVSFDVLNALLRLHHLPYCLLISLSQCLYCLVQRYQPFYCNISC